MDFWHDTISSTQENYSHNWVNVTIEYSSIKTVFVVFESKECQSMQIIFGYTIRNGGLQFFEMANFEPYCQLKTLESLPLKLVCWYVLIIKCNFLSCNIATGIHSYFDVLTFRHDPKNENKTLLLIGDKDVCSVHESKIILTCS